MSSPPRAEMSLAERLERGELLSLPSCPFPLPVGEDRTTLLSQRLEEPRTLLLGYDPQRHRAYGFARHSENQATRLADLFASCAAQALRWLAQTFPGYADAVELSLVAFHPEEEATRKLRTLDRNDLLHVDASPAQPTHGRRQLRLFVNLHPTDPRVWQTSLSFAELLERHSNEIGWPPLRHGWRRLLRPDPAPASSFDEFMQGMHDYLKRNERFQEAARKKCWQFPPGACWLVFTDGIAHAELRGRCVLEFAFLIAEHGLVCPSISPHALFQGAFSTSGTSKAA